MSDGEAERIGKKLNVSRETLKRLEGYQSLLLKWQHGVNLISNSTIQDVWNRHIIDSHQLIRFIPEYASVLDMGSGAGLPGMVIAICRPDCKITLAESDIKKCTFLKEATRVSQCSNIEISAGRLELMEEKKYQIITSRALGSLIKLLELGYKFTNQNTYCIFPKGRIFQKEIEEAREVWSFDADVVPSVTSEDSRIVIIHNLAKAAKQ